MSSNYAVHRTRINGGAPSDIAEQRGQPMLCNMYTLDTPTQLKIIKLAPIHIEEKPGHYRTFFNSRTWRKTLRLIEPGTKLRPERKASIISHEPIYQQPGNKLRKLAD